MVRSNNLAESLPPGFALIATGRFVTNVGVRAVYPFLPAIADGLGVSLTALGSALALRELAGVATPMIGARLDRAHLGRAMAVGLGGVGAAAALAAASTDLVMFTLALTVLSVAKTVCDVSGTSWIAHHVPFARRGRAIGIIELTWALSFLVAMPVLALVIRAGTWRTPYILVAVATLPIAALTATDIDRPSVRRPQRRTARPSGALLVAPIAAMAAMGVGHQAILVSFAAWLEDEHGLTVASLGLTALILGAAELIGTALSTRLSDEIGKRRCVRAGAVVLVPMMVALPIGNASVVLAIALLAATFAIFEFTFVSFLPLFSEIDPLARATVMAWAFGSFGAGHALGAAVGASLYDSVGIGAVAPFGAAAFVAAAAIVHLALSEPGSEPDSHTRVGPA